MSKLESNHLRTLIETAGSKSLKRGCRQFASTPPNKTEREIIIKGIHGQLYKTYPHSSQPIAWWKPAIKRSRNVAVQTFRIRETNREWYAIYIISNLYNVIILPYSCNSSSNTPHLQCWYTNQSVTGQLRLVWPCQLGPGTFAGLYWSVWNLVFVS